jgi:predicted TIM-barrel fold metal-dependent hydrolase
MFESDYPHPTTLSPGLGSTAQDARTTIANNLAHVPDEIRHKVLHDNAARIYHLDA